MPILIKPRSRALSEETDENREKEKKRSQYEFDKSLKIFLG